MRRSGRFDFDPKDKRNHRASGVMFIIDPDIAAALPDPETITSRDAERAYDWLVNGWFGEVAASDDNKAVLRLPPADRHAAPFVARCAAGVFDNGSGRGREERRPSSI